MSQTGISATAICSSDSQLFVYQDNAISVYTWMGRLQLSYKLSNPGKQPAFLKPFYSDESISDPTYTKIVDGPTNESFKIT